MNNDCQTRILLDQVDEVIWLACERVKLAGGWDSKTGWLVLLTFEGLKQRCLDVSMFHQVEP